MRKYRGVFHGVKVILQNEGPRGLLRGLGSAVRFYKMLSPSIVFRSAAVVSSIANRYRLCIVHVPDSVERVSLGLLRTHASGSDLGDLQR